MPGHGFLVENASGGIGITKAILKKAKKRTPNFILYHLLNSMASLALKMVLKNEFIFLLPNQFVMAKHANY